MTALLVLYMVNQLLLPGHVEHVAGLRGVPRSLIEGVVRPAVDAGARVADFRLYSGFVYFTPVLGGWSPTAGSDSATPSCSARCG